MVPYMSGDGILCLIWKPYARLQILSACNKCEGTWLQSGIEVLTSKIHPFIFAHSLRELLEKGCGKFRNIMTVGPANCGKPSS